MKSEMNVDEKKYITAFKKDKITVNGFSLPKKYEQLKEQLDDLEVNDCDVWIVTFPKSGKNTLYWYFCIDDCGNQKRNNMDGRNGLDDNE